MQKLFKIKLISTDKSLLKWKSLKDKEQEILNELSDVKNAVFSLEIEYQDLVPEVVNGRITEKWMNSISQPLKVSFVALHFSEAQKKKWKVIPTSRGIHMRDKDNVGEVYFWANEKTKRGKYNQFVQTFLHELRHAFKYGTKEFDDTHEIHDTGDIRGSFKTIDMAKYNTSLFQQIVEKLKTPETLAHPVTYGSQYISQPYGVLNPIYKITGRHIGTDYAIPLGTPLIAPWNGEVTTSGTHPALGNFCHYTYTYKGQIYEERWCHLQYPPEMGKYSRGSKVALSGNTGMSTGPHLHREVWYNDVRTDLINKSNWDKLTTDPTKLV